MIILLLSDVMEYQDVSEGRRKSVRPNGGATAFSSGTAIESLLVVPEALTMSAISLTVRCNSHFTRD